MKNILTGLLLVPCTLVAMEKGTVPKKTAPSPDDVMIRVTASFNSSTEHKKKEFSRFQSTQCIECDDSGNATIVDNVNISIKTNKLLPMFQVDLKTLAINLLSHQLKLSCTTTNQGDKAQTQTIELMLPLDRKYTDSKPLTLLDDTGTPVMLSIETWKNLDEMNSSL